MGDSRMFAVPKAPSEIIHFRSENCCDESIQSVRQKLPIRILEANSFKSFFEKFSEATEDNILEMNMEILQVVFILDTHSVSRCLHLLCCLCYGAQEMCIASGEFWSVNCIAEPTLALQRGCEIFVNHYIQLLHENRDLGTKTPLNVEVWSLELCPADVAIRMPNML